MGWFPYWWLAVDISSACRPVVDWVCSGCFPLFKRPTHSPRPRMNVSHWTALKPERKSLWRWPCVDGFDSGITPTRRDLLVHHQFTSRPHLRPHQQQHYPLPERPSPDTSKSLAAWFSRYKGLPAFVVQFEWHFIQEFPAQNHFLPSFLCLKWDQTFQKLLLEAFVLPEMSKLCNEYWHPFMGLLSDLPRQHVEGWVGEIGRRLPQSILD